MGWVGGVDGCRGGWVVVRVPCGQPHSPHQVVVCRTFGEVLALRPRAALLAVDIPIGLLETPEPGGRMCDRLARAVLGRPRASSVFSPPARRDLRARTFRSTQGLSRQAFGILPKIREVDRQLTPALQHRVFECHPEVAFAALAGIPMRWNKKTPEGRRERLRALRRAPIPRVRRLTAHFQNDLAHLRSRAAADDLLDAYVLTAIALRRAQKTARCLPRHPPTDRRGLRMEIWY